MKANRFFSVSYDIRHHPKVDMLRAEAGGVLAFGRWVILLSLLYESDGRIDISKSAVRKYLMRELETSDEAELGAFLQACADVDLISAEFLAQEIVTANSVCEQLDYYKQKSEAGKKGNEKRWGGKNRTRESH